MAIKDEESESVLIPDDLWSDDSSFYGDDKVNAEYEDRVSEFNPKEFLEIQKWNLRCIAAQEITSLESKAKSPSIKRKREESTPASPQKKVEREKPKKPEAPISSNTRTKREDSKVTDSSSFFNPYQGDDNAKQNNESVSDFLARLPPSTTTSSSGGPWIWIANTHAKRHPESTTSGDIASFKDSGQKLLEAYIHKKETIESRNRGKNEANITRLLKPDRDQLENDILQLAKDKNVTCGKWMLFPSPQHVDEVWEEVAKATFEGTLGGAAKVATSNDDDKAKSEPVKTERLVCVYTEDFSDVKDVERVVKEMSRLRLMRSTSDEPGQRARPIYYKADAYTYLDISSGNEYKLKASMYCSRDFLG